MPKEKLKTIYVCTQCGETSPRWLGRCPSCGAWNTMTEDVVAEPAKTAGTRSSAPARVWDCFRLRLRSSVSTAGTTAAAAATA